MEESDERFKQKWQRMAYLFRLSNSKQDAEQDDNEAQRVCHRAESMFVKFFGQSETMELMENIALNEERRNSTRNDPEVEEIMKELEERELLFEKLNRLIKRAQHNSSASSVIQPDENETFYRRKWALEELLWIVKERMHNAAESLPQYSTKDVLLISKCARNENSEFHEAFYNIVENFNDFNVKANPAKLPQPQKNDKFQLPTSNVIPTANLSSGRDGHADTKLDTEGFNENNNKRGDQKSLGIDEAFMEHTGAETSGIENLFVSNTVDYFAKAHKQQRDQNVSSCNMWTELFVQGIHRIQARNKTDLLIEVFMEWHEAMIKRWSLKSLFLFKDIGRLMEKTPFNSLIDFFEIFAVIEKKTAYTMENVTNDFDQMSENGGEVRSSLNTFKDDVSETLNASFDYGNNSTPDAEHHDMLGSKNPTDFELLLRFISNAEKKLLELFYLKNLLLRFHVLRQHSWNSASNRSEKSQVYLNQHQNFVYDRNSSKHVAKKIMTARMLVIPMASCRRGGVC